jgi:hypothetical protein
MIFDSFFQLLHILKVTKAIGSPNSFGVKLLNRFLEISGENDLFEKSLLRREKELHQNKCKFKMIKSTSLLNLFMVSAYMMHSLPMETFGTLETVAGPKSFLRMRNVKTRTFLITKKSQLQGEEGRGLWIYDERVNVRFCECFVGRAMEIQSDSLLIIILKQSS